MSLVTNIIISHDICENENAVLAEINRWMEMNHHNPLVKLEWNAYKSQKVLERPTYIAAANYLDADALATHLKTIKWEFPQNVQMLVCGQEESRYTFLIDGIDALSK